MVFLSFKEPGNVHKLDDYGPSMARMTDRTVLIALNADALYDFWTRKDWWTADKNPNPKVLSMLLCINYQHLSIKQLLCLFFSRNLTSYFQILCLFKHMSDGKTESHNFSPADPRFGNNF